LFSHVRIAENQTVGELLYGKNVACEGLTRLPAEYLLRISKRRGICTMGSGHPINFLSPLRDLERVSRYPPVLVWEEENREECQVRVVGEYESSIEKRCWCESIVIVEQVIIEAQCHHTVQWTVVTGSWEIGDEVPAFPRASPSHHLTRYSPPMGSQNSKYVQIT